ncbi:hypothetical protein [Pelagicoccus sp. SDUM812003]|uniref:hypothetical protein n=1 Tax=Pelagicoccus sp. SDUM812003 TaxID=3041267 RepID=UPI00280E1E5A|nr:hypothetical protein [Pelagicoccus sp. SDUM812003]MDQ8204876.1 hypothetical protein [Pelagicoccus sp. SDUM812003]
MSHTEEPNKSTPEQEEPQSPANVAADDDLGIVDAMKPPSAPSTDKPIRYGTRKQRAGAEAPAVTSLNSIKTFEEEEIEMDDLPIRANAPEHLIDSRPNPSERRERDGEERPRRQRRSREEHPGNDRRRRSSETPSETDSEANAIEANEAEQPEDRPERFGMVENRESDSSQPTGVQEFRPSRDGRVAPKRERKPRSESGKPSAQPKKKGLLSKIISFFTGDESKEEESKSSPRRQSSDRPRNRNRRGPGDRQNREGDENQDGRPRRRKRRPRNRGPRGENQGGNAEGQQNREGGQRRRRRRPRRSGGPRQRESASSQKSE